MFQVRLQLLQPVATCPCYSYRIKCLLTMLSIRAMHREHKALEVTDVHVGLQA